MSAARKLIESVEEIGARLWVEGERLRYASRGPLPERIVVDLRQHKEEIIAELRRAEVARRLDAMAAENARRRDWHTKPVEGWREGRLTVRSVVTGEETIVYLPRGRTQH
jgi:hypothetical protein